MITILLVSECPATIGSCFSSNFFSSPVVTHQSACSRDGWLQLQQAGKMNSNTKSDLETFIESMRKVTKKYMEKPPFTGGFFQMTYDITLFFFFFTQDDLAVILDFKAFDIRSFGISGKIKDGLTKGIKSVFFIFQWLQVALVITGKEIKFRLFYNNFYIIKRHSFYFIFSFK